MVTPEAIGLEDKPGCCSVLCPKHVAERGEGVQDQFV